MSVWWEASGHIIFLATLWGAWECFGSYRECFLPFRFDSPPRAVFPSNI
jgi:hypothetical protein